MAPISQNKQTKPVWTHKTERKVDWPCGEVEDLPLLSSILAQASLPLEELQLVQGCAFMNVSAYDS